MSSIVKKMQFADKIASRSKDPSTKVGANFKSIYNGIPTHPISFGYNGMPRGLNDNHPERKERPEKYLWYEHAERNAIYNAARPILQDKIIFVSSFPNMESARGIVSSGISEVVTDFSTYDKQDPMHKRVMQLFEETGVKLELLDLNNHQRTFEELMIKHNIDSNSYHVKEYKKQYSTLDKLVYFLEVAKEYGETESISETNKNGCLVLDKEHYNPITAGVYGPPANLPVTDNVLQNEALFFQEDVKNAIYNAARSVLKDSLAEVTWCPCQKCALGIVSVASSKVVTRKPDFTKENDLRWKPEFEKSEIIFKEANIEVEYLEVPNLEEIKKPKGGIKS
jgi:dCMP deaminase